MRRLSVLWVACLLGLPSSVALRAQQQPAEVTFLSQGQAIHAVLFRGEGTGPRPTAVLLHGFPGGEGDVLGLGALLSADGWNVLAMNYRGAFRNEGEHTPLNTLADAAAALDYLDAGGSDFAADGRYAVIGYSYGGWVALHAGATDPRVACVAGLMPGNVGVIAEEVQKDPASRGPWESMLDAGLRESRFRSPGGVAAVQEILDHAADLDIRSHGAALGAKPVLLVAGWRDRTASLETFVLPMSRAIEAAGGSGNLTPVVVDDDHDLRRTRPEVREAVRSWMRERCRATTRP